MNHADWINLFAPAIGALLLAIVGVLVALLSGLTGKLNAYFTARGQASAATAVSAANNVIDKALMTGASVIAGKIQTGQIDYTDRKAIEAEAIKEVALAQARVPEMMAIAAPVAGALVASLMGKVDAQVVASPTIGAPVPVNTP